MRLIEDVSSIPKQVIVPSAIPLPPTNIPLTEALPQQKRHFKQRGYSAMIGDPVHKLELKQALLLRIDDPELKAQFEEEIKELQKQIQKDKNQRN